jgi:hypothetical protein
VANLESRHHRSEKLTVSQLFRKLRALFGSQKFITVFTRARYWYLSWAIWTQSIPFHPISLRSTLILSCHLCLGLLSGLFPLGFPSKILYAFLVSYRFIPSTPTFPYSIFLSGSPIKMYAFIDSHMRATCPAQLTLLDLIPKIRLTDGRAECQVLPRFLIRTWGKA